MPANKPNKQLELSLIRACPVRCNYCPQDALRLANNRLAISSEHEMRFTDYNRILHNAASESEDNLEVLFAGFTEPARHSKFLDFLEYAESLPFVSKISVFTTGSGLNGSSLIRMRRLKKLRGNLRFHVRHPDNYEAMKGYSGGIWTRLGEIARTKLKPNFLVVQESISQKELDEIAEILKPHGIRYTFFGHVSRAGLLPVLNGTAHSSIGYVDKPVVCRYALPETRKPVVTPDGKAYACCNDFALQFPVGNLATGDWNSLQWEELTEIQGNPEEHGNKPCFQDCHYARLA